MPIRLLVFQDSGQPLGGLCAQLQSADHQILSCGSFAELQAIVHGQDVDVAIVDARSKTAEAVFDRIGRDPSLNAMPIMVVADDDEMVGVISSWSCRIDDIVILPVVLDDLKHRLRRLARLASMSEECRRRREALADFGIAISMDASASDVPERIDALIVGAADRHQIEILQGFEGHMMASYARGPNEAIAQLEHGQVDIVMATPDLSADDFGDLLRRVRSTPAWSDLPIVVSADETPRHLAEGQGDDVEVLSAGCHPLAVRRHLEILARQWRLRRQLRGYCADRRPSQAFDALTGLYSHSFFHHYLDGAILEHQRRSATLAIAVCSIRGLSEINRTWGYPEGDRRLVAFAQRLDASCRAEDIVARTGGCQFALLLRETSPLEAVIACHRLMDVVGDALSRRPAGSRFALECAFGVSALTDGDDASTLIGRAAAQAKLSGFRQAS